MPVPTQSFSLRRVALGGPAPELSPASSPIDGRMHCALTDMYAYALFLEAESRRTASREVREEVAALKDVISVLRAQVGPAADRV